MTVPSLLKQKKWKYFFASDMNYSGCTHVSLPMKNLVRSKLSTQKNVLILMFHGIYIWPPAANGQELSDKRTDSLTHHTPFYQT